MPKAHGCFKRSDLNCAGQRAASELIRGAPDGVRSAPVFALSPNLPSEARIEGVRCRENANSKAAIRNR
eukprot:202371-Alexandrium_andersonii.AAC.1